MAIKEFFKHYKFFIIIPLMILIILTLILAIISNGTQNGAFMYQLR